jgi:hypothetical protein
MLVRKEPHSCKNLMKSRSMDYEGPFAIATVFSGNKTQEDYAPFQSPFRANTKREDFERLPEESPILIAIRLGD